MNHEITNVMRLPAADNTFLNRNRGSPDSGVGYGGEGAASARVHTVVESHVRLFVGAGPEGMWVSLSVRQARNISFSAPEELTKTKGVGAAKH